MPASIDSAQSAKPSLVSIGIPTYNRVHGLRRAVESVLSQSYAEIELIISDNASTDDTLSYCRDLAEREPRVRYYRQPSNIGPMRNFAFVLRHANGRYFKWLADDDWVDSEFLAPCVDFLDHNRDYVLVAGAGRYYAGDRIVREISPPKLASDSASERVLQFYSVVDQVPGYFGVMRRDDALRAPLDGVVGHDWYTLAAIAFLGKMAVLDDVKLEFSAGGLSSHYKPLVRSSSSPALLAKSLTLFNLGIVAYACADILWKSSVYRPLDLTQRGRLSAGVAQILFKRRVVPVARKEFSAARHRLMSAVSSRVTP